MFSELASLRKKALRRGLWFRILSRVERSIYDITMRAVSTIRSERLMRAMTAIVEKLRRALESPVAALTRSVGRQLASTMARIAYSWGHEEALEWASDEQFAKYLAICYMNVPKYYKDRFAPP